MDVMKLFVHVLDGHLKLVNLIVDVLTAILMMCLGMLCKMFFVELFRLFIDALVLLDVLLVMVVATVTTKAQVNDVDRLVVNEDVHV